MNDYVGYGSEIVS